MARPDWLTARPIAHRGLHDAAKGIIENTPSAVAAAVAAGYAIEVDLQITADGEAMVHHDAALGRLTEGESRLAELSAAELKHVRFKATADRMMPLGDLLDLVGGRVGLFLELKSAFDRDLRLPRRAAKVLKSRADPVAAMSFDPHQVAAMRDFAPGVPRGIVAERHRPAARTGANHDDEPGRHGAAAALSYILQSLHSRPHFLAYSVKDLPPPIPPFARNLIGLDLLTWTVRTEDDRRRAARFADQMIFEGFRP